MTLMAAWWLQEQADTRFEKLAYGVGGALVAGSPYHAIGRVATHLDDLNYWAHAARVNRSHHAYMARRGMQISSAGAAEIAFTQGRFIPMARPGSFPVRILRGRGVRIAAKLGGRLVPGLGWALLAYDVYTVAKMISD